MTLNMLPINMVLARAGLAEGSGSGQSAGASLVSMREDRVPAV